MYDPAGFVAALSTIAIAAIFLLAAVGFVRARRVWGSGSSWVTLLPRTLASAPRELPAWHRFIPLAVLVLVYIGAVLRLVGITRQSLWLDEAFSAYLAAQRFPTILQFVSGSDAHPPLYYLLLHLWLIFGPSALAMRLLSAIASIAALLPMYLLARRLTNPRVALLATALMAFSAFQVWYAQEVRMYALVTLATVTAMYAFVRAWQSGEFRAWALFMCSMLAALYLDYSALYIFSALTIWFGIVGWRNTRKRAAFVLCGAAILLAYLPWLPVLWRQLVVGSGLIAWIGGANGSGLVGVLTDLFFNRANLLQPDTGTVAMLMNILSVALLAFALWVPRRASTYPFLAIWLCWPLTLGMAAGLLNHPILIARTMMVVQPALILLLAMAADSLWLRRRVSQVARPLLAALALCLGIFLTTNIAAVATSWTITLKEDWRGASTLVAARQQPGDLVLFDAYFVQMPFDYYLYQHHVAPGSLVEHGYQAEEVLLYANLTPPGGGAQPGSPPSGYARVWLVLSHGGGTSAEGAAARLGSRYTMMQQWQLNGITVQLYQER